MASSTMESPRIESHDQEKAVKILKRLDGPPRKSMRASELTAVQHAMPKSYVSHAILHENPSHDRHLSLHMTHLHRRQHQYTTSHDMSRKAFIDQQQRKHRTWKSQDETKAAGMNFPTLRADAKSFNKAPQQHLNPGSAATTSSEVMYKSPRYFGKSDEVDVDLPDGAQRLMPYMSLRRERTEFLKFHGKTYMTRLPTVIISDSKKMERYHTYCGKDMLDLGTPAKDDRFKKLANSLSAPATDGMTFFMDELEDEPLSKHGHLVTQSLGATNDSDSSNKESSQFALRPRKSQSPVNRSKVVFPSLSRTNTLAGNAPSNQFHDGERPKLIREQTEPNLKIKRGKGKSDGKTSGVDELRHKYGKLKCSYETKDIKEETEETNEREDGRYTSPTLQRSLTVKSQAVQAPGEE